jgi:hypothetical protein
LRYVSQPLVAVLPADAGPVLKTGPARSRLLKTPERKSTVVVRPEEAGDLGDETAVQAGGSKADCSPTKSKERLLLADTQLL